MAGVITVSPVFAISGAHLRGTLSLLGKVFPEEDNPRNQRDPGQIGGKAGDQEDKGRDRHRCPENGAIVAVDSAGKGVPAEQAHHRCPEDLVPASRCQDGRVVDEGKGDDVRRDAEPGCDPAGLVRVGLGYSGGGVRWRGAAPINAAILNGDEKTGVTIMKMDVGLDTGPTLASRSIQLTRDDTTGSVSAALSNLGAELLMETLPDYLAGKLMPTPQPAEGVTYAPMLKKEDGQLDFTRPAEELERRVRAMNPWPGAWFEYNGQPLKVLKARADILFTSMMQTPGARLVTGNQLVVATSKDFLFLEEVQPPGKKPMDGKAFLAGARDWK